MQENKGKQENRNGNEKGQGAKAKRANSRSFTPKKRWYTDIEKQEIAKRISDIVERSEKGLIDKILQFSLLLDKDPKSAEFVEIEDINSQKMVRNIREYGKIKKVSKFRALNELPGIVEFENRIIKEYAAQIAECSSKNICDGQQREAYLKANPKSKKSPVAKPNKKDKKPVSEDTKPTEKATKEAVKDTEPAKEEVKAPEQVELTPADKRKATIAAKKALENK